jgi:small subunit ribosomal protein S5
MAGENNKVKTTNDLELKDRLVAINRVTKVTKGGRTFSFAAIVVVGNEDGIVGWGLGKAGEVTSAIAKGVEAAKKNLVKVPVLKGTGPHEQVARFGGAEVFLKPASHGTGVKAGGAMRAVLESVGVTDVLAKSKGSSNPHNLVKATIAALSEMRDAYTVAQNRGVSMEKVFKG